MPGGVPIGLLTQIEYRPQRKGIPSESRITTIHSAHNNRSSDNEKRIIGEVNDRSNGNNGSGSTATPTTRAATESKP